MECNCSSMEHLVRFSCWEDELPNHKLIYGHIHLADYGSIWRRVWKAFRYAIGYRCRYGEWEEVIIDKDKAIELRDYLIKIINNWDPLPRAEYEQAIEVAKELNSRIELSEGEKEYSNNLADLIITYECNNFLT